MEMLQQIFMTIIAAFGLFVLFAKIASAVINGGKVDHDSSKVFNDEIRSNKMEKSSSSKRKSMKKVRFAVDHDEFVVNKVVAGPSETKQVVFEKNFEKFEDDCKNNNADYDYNKSMNESVSDCVVDKSELVVIHDENVGIGNEDQMSLKLLSDDDIDEAVKEKEGLISEEDDDDDDWEGVERSELEKVFAMAADYGKVDEHLQSLENDIQMQLYGLHKVATEGPCHEAQPMALKLSARAKWNAWQKLGNMNPDVAMEQYISLLSEKVPGWSIEIHSFGGGLSSSILDTSQTERKSEIQSCSDVGELIGVSDSVNKDKH